MTTTTLNETPYAEEEHVRFDDWEVASVKSQHWSPLCKPCALLTVLLFVSASLWAGYLEERTSSAGVSNTDMPEIYLIGDSIRMGYCENVATALTGRASVRWPEGNCMNSQNILINLGWWRKFASSPKVIQFNCGHWDATDWDQDGEPITTIDEYRRNVRLIIRRLRRYYPDAKLVFATTTPMNPKLSDAKILARRTTDVIRRYNEAAIAVAKEENVPLNDLFAMTEDWPAEDFADYCHFTPAANVRLGAAVGEFLFSLATAQAKESVR